MISNDLQLLYVGNGAGWRVEIFARWSDIVSARTGTERMIAHLKKVGINSRCIRGNIEPFSGLFEVVVSTDVKLDTHKVIAALKTPRL